MISHCGSAARICSLPLSVIERVVEIQLAKLLELGQPLGAGVGDVGAVEAEPLEFGRPARAASPLSPTSV